MSYLSTSENVGFSGISQNISDTSCATQYKMAVDSVPGVCNSEMNIFIHDSSGDEQSYLPHFSDNFFHTKFKIDSNDLYTFNDSDVVAGEITVSNTEENFVFPENVDVKTKYLESPNKDIDLLQSITNGDIKDEGKAILRNGHYSPSQTNVSLNNLEAKKSNTKAQKTKSQNHVTADLLRIPEICQTSIHSPKSQAVVASPHSNKASISNGSANVEKSAALKSISETFLDVFKREQGVSELSTSTGEIKSEPYLTPAKSTAKKQSVKSSSQSKPRKGRGPTVHEALQRIPSQRRAVALPNTVWHAPGEEMFNCGPLDDKRPNAFRQLESSSSDDDNMPEFASGFGPMCVEESAAESRGARLELRRAAMRRHVARTAASLHLTRGHRSQHALAEHIKKQINSHNAAGRLSTTTTNHLLATRGMTSLLSIRDRRRLRESGWSGGESGRSKDTPYVCAEGRCLSAPLPCSTYCVSHVTRAPEQRLYAPCAAVFAGGERCKQPLLPLHDQTPLCAEHAWKRDNYEMLSASARECKPQKLVRKRAWAGEARRRPKRRRRLVPRRASPPRPAHRPAEQSLAEINVCSNSSTYDSSEDAAVGALSETEYISANNSHDLAEVGQVPPDDILDPSVLGQMPDEAFTEFFNTAEGGASFAESSELAAALEAVLEERVLDERALDIADVFAPHTHAPHAHAHAPHAHAHAPHAHAHAPHAQATRNKIQVLAPVERSSSAPS